MHFAAISSLFTAFFTAAKLAHLIFGFGGAKIMTTCPSAWTPAPSDATAPFSSACYKASGYAISLRECVERCALDGAAPVCPASAAENNFV